MATLQQEQAGDNAQLQQDRERLASELAQVEKSLKLFLNKNANLEQTIKTNTESVKKQAKQIEQKTV